MKRFSGFFSRSSQPSPALTIEPLDAPLVIRRLLLPPPRRTAQQSVNLRAPLRIAVKPNFDKALPIVPFKAHFPTDIFRIIVDMYVYDCRLNGDLRGISRLMRSSPLLHLWLAPDVYRFVTLSSLDSITSFGLSLSTARRYTQAIDVSSEVPRLLTYITIRSIILHLEGGLQRLCLPHNYEIPFSFQVGSLFVSDVTLFYNSRSIPGDIRCTRLRLALSYADIEFGAAPLINHLPFNGPLWICPHRHVTSLAFELSREDFGTLNRVYEIYLNFKFTALQQCVAIIYFRSQASLDDTRRHGRMFRNSTNDKFHLVYLLFEEYKDWTFGVLEWRGEDFWEKIQTRFEAI